MSSYPASHPLDVNNNELLSIHLIFIHQQIRQCVLGLILCYQASSDLAEVLYVLTEEK